MDDYRALIDQADRCRRLAGGLFERSDVDGLKAMAREFEDRAAAAMTRQLAAHRDTDTARDCAYAISRGRLGWVVNRGADRIATRPTLESAHEAAQRLLGFDGDAQ